MSNDSDSADPMNLRARGYRFIVRGEDATWRKSYDRKEGDIDVTDIDDEEELAMIFKRESNKVIHPN